MDNYLFQQIFCIFFEFDPNKDAILLSIVCKIIDLLKIFNPGFKYFLRLLTLILILMEHQEDR